MSDLKEHTELPGEVETMDAPTRVKVVELLEVAHGYAIAGSIMPFRTACIELDLKGSEVAQSAAAIVDRARTLLVLPPKPTPERYRDALAMALERVENGKWP